MRRLIPTVLLLLLFAAAPGRGATVSEAVETAELYPVAPGTDTQRGFAVAVDRGWLAVGAPLDDAVARNAGAVHLFRWSDGRWEPAQTLYPDTPQARSHFGAALALRDGVLAVGAPGVGLVELFRIGEGAWELKKKVRREDLMPGFGRLVALSRKRLAVGNTVPGRDGLVFLYDLDPGSMELNPLRAFSRDPEERFGEALALSEDGGTLAVGAPGFGDAAGAVYVYAAASGWKPVQLAGQKAGEQLGFAVAVSEDRLAAAGADRLGDGKAALYVFERSGAKWSRPVQVLAKAGGTLAMDGNLLVAGAPAPFSNSTGTVRVLRHDDRAGWIELSALLPANSEPHDLAGYAVAVRGTTVAVGAVLGDQGGAAAGAAWTFDCPPGKSCSEEAEAVVRDPGMWQNVGASLALNSGLLAVGVAHPPATDSNAVEAVYVYRRAGSGWRQEARLRSPQTRPGDDGFGSAMALSGDLLAVGAPCDIPSPVSGEPGQGGVVYLYRRGSQRTWHEQPAEIDSSGPGEQLGASLAFANDTLVIGAPGPGYDKGPGRIWVLRLADRSIEAIAGDQSLERFGAAVASDGQYLAVGAPAAAPPQAPSAGKGSVRIFQADAAHGFNPRPVENLQVNDQKGGFGSALAFIQGRLIVGAEGAVYTFQTGSWDQPIDVLTCPATCADFGATLAASGDKLLVGQAGGALLYTWRNNGWKLSAGTPETAEAETRSLAIDDRSFVVGASGDHVTVFGLPE